MNNNNGRNSRPNDSSDHEYSDDRYRDRGYPDREYSNDRYRDRGYPGPESEYDDNHNNMFRDPGLDAEDDYLDSRYEHRGHKDRSKLKYSRNYRYDQSDSPDYRDEADSRGRSRMKDRGTGHMAHEDGKLSYNHPKKKRRRRIPLAVKALIGLFAIFLIFVLFLRLGFGTVRHVSLNHNNLKGVTKDKNMSQYRNIVLFGVDDQDNKIKDKGSRTDCIIIASIRKSNHKVKLMSVYRDTYVSIDGKYDKINAAYSYGGPELALQTINRNLDLNIEDFVTVNFKSLADAVDILGGIKLTIKTKKELKNLNDYIGNMNKINGGNSKKFDAPGTYTFDGNQAVAYSRIRYMEGGDHERANHQRIVVDAILKKAKVQPWKIPIISAKILPQCKTNLSANDMTLMSSTLLMTDISDSQAYPFDSIDTKYNGIYYGFPKTVKKNVKKAHKYLFETKDYKVSEELGRISEKVEAAIGSDE